VAGTQWATQAGISKICVGGKTAQIPAPHASIHEGGHYGHISAIADCGVHRLAGGFLFGHDHDFDHTST
jgi:hypothetical protein